MGIGGSGSGQGAGARSALDADVVLLIGALAPVPVFTVLRVPACPQPPLLRSGADGRRS